MSERKELLARKEGMFTALRDCKSDILLFCGKLDSEDGCKRQVAIDWIKEIVVLAKKANDMIDEIEYELRMLDEDKE